MSLVNMKEMLEHARKGRYAVGHFNVFNIEMLRGAVMAGRSKILPSFSPLLRCLRSW